MHTHHTHTHTHTPTVQPNNLKGVDLLRITKKSIGNMSLEDKVSLLGAGLRERKPVTNLSRCLSTDTKSPCPPPHPSSISYYDKWFKSNSKKLDDTQVQEEMG